MTQIRNVPDGPHRRLKSRAALAGMSLSDYLPSEIRRWQNGRRSTSCGRFCKAVRARRLPCRRLKPSALNARVWESRNSLTASDAVYIAWPKRSTRHC
jgi:predicted nucleic acid-binding protein